MMTCNEKYNPGGYSAELGGYPVRAGLGQSSAGLWRFILLMAAIMLLRHYFGFGILPPEIMQYIHTNGEPPVPVGKAAFISLAVLTFASFMMDMGSNLVDCPSDVEEAAQELGSLGLVNGVTGIGLFGFLAYHGHTWPAFAVLLLFTGFAVLIALNAMRQVGFWRVLHCVLWGVMILSLLKGRDDRRHR